MKLSLIISAIDRATAPVRKIKTAVTGLAGSGGIGRLISQGRAAGRAVDRIGGGPGLRARLRGLLGDVRRLAGRAGLGLLQGTLKSIGSIGGKGLALAAAGGAGLLGYLTGGVVSIASQFEQFQVVLENTEGSAAKARKAMAWVKDFAKTTPYEVGQVMEAFVALKAYGLDPMDGTLRSLGNAASGMNKDLMAAIEMMADAQTGEFERLKEFGVRAKVQGEKVSFTYMKAGKEVTATAKKSAAEIKKALTGIFDARFAGMMDRQSRTLKGLWSNLQDMFANFQLDVAGAGFFDVLKGHIQRLLDKVNELARNGTLSRWAQKISAWLEKVVNWMAKVAKETDWSRLAADIMAVARAVWTVARATAALVNAIASVPRWALMMGPGGASAIGAALAGGNSAPRQSATQRPQGRLPAGWAPTRSGRAPAPGFRLGPPIRVPERVNLRRPTADVRGRIQLEVSAKGGAEARVKSVRSASNDVHIDVTRGRVQAA